MLQQPLARQRQRHARHYDAHQQIQQLLAQRLLERLDLVTVTPKVILDVGCATGYTSRLLQKRYPKARIIGIDPAPALLRQAQKQRRWLSKQSFVGAMADRVPLQSQCIDLLVSNLHPVWYLDITALFAEFGRLMTDNGLCLFSSLGPDSLTDFKQIHQALDPDYPHLMPFADMHDVGDAFGKGGFKGIVMESEPLTINYDNYAQLENDLRLTGQANLHPERRRTLLGRQRYQQWRAEHPENAAIDCQLEVIYGHGWAGYAKAKIAEHDYRPDGINIPTKVSY